MISSPKRVGQRKRATGLGKAKPARDKTSPETENKLRRKNHQTATAQKPALNQLKTQPTDKTKQRETKAKRNKTTQKPNHDG
jgi:hypothetical protein